MKNLLSKRYSPISLALASALTLSNAALAQDFEIILVTADKLGSNSLQEMAAAVNLQTGEDLEKKGANEFIDFIATIPGLQFQDAGPGDREYVIRGINSVGASTVGVYFDEVPITASNGQDGGGRNVELKLVDLDTVETFNGPQGTQYGANSMSGLVRYMPNKPDTDFFEGNVIYDASVTKDGGFNNSLNGVINVPLVGEKLGLRVVGWLTDNDGWIDQPVKFSGAVEDANTENTGGGRVLLRWLPKENMVLDYMYMQQDMFIAANSSYVPKGTEWTEGEIAEDDFINYDYGESPWEEDLAIHLLTGSVDYDFGSFIFAASNSERNISFFQDDSGFRGRDGDRATLITDFQPQSRDVTSLEVRFSSFFDGDYQFVLGYLYQDEANAWRRVNVRYDEDFDFKGFNPNNPPDTLELSRDVTANFDLQQHALFGEVSYEATDDIVINVGGRYFQSEQNALEFAIMPDGELSDVLTEKSDDTQSSLKASISYQGFDDVNLYAVISQGFRVGGLNPNTGGDVRDIPISFKPDSLTNYELGFKSELLDGDLTFNGSFYYINWVDMQIRQYYGSTPFIGNAGETDIYGAEFSVDYPFWDNFNLQLSATFTDAALAIDQIIIEEQGRQLEDDVGLKGDRIPNVPYKQGYVAIEHEKELSFGSLYTRADLTYRGQANTYFDTTNSYNYNLQSTSVASLRTTLSFHNSGWAVTAYANNLFNAVADNDALYADGTALKVYGAKPRTIGLRVQKSFE